MSNVLTHEETVLAIENNEPPLEPGQEWAIPDKDGQHTEYRLRVIAPYLETYPDGKPAVGNNSKYWITEDVSTVKHRMGPPWEIGRIPEYNIRRIYRLVDEVAP